MDTKREGVCLEACALCAANDRLECTRVLAPRMVVGMPWACTTHGAH